MKSVYRFGGMPGIQYLETMGKHMVNAKRKALTSRKSDDQ
jgi:hypothetical protein